MGTSKERMEFVVNRAYYEGVAKMASHVVDAVNEFYVTRELTDTERNLVSELAVKISLKIDRDIAELQNDIERMEKRVYGNTTSDASTA